MIKNISKYKQKGGFMKNLDYDSDFTKDLLCLKLQFETLFENAGGEECINLLNLISKLSGAEREIILKQFSNITKNLLKNRDRKKSLKDIEDEKFENELYDSIEDEFNNIQIKALTPPLPQSRFKVLNGGKSRARSKIIKFRGAIS